MDHIFLDQLYFRSFTLFVACRLYRLFRCDRMHVWRVFLTLLNLYHSYLSWVLFFVILMGFLMFVEVKLAIVWLLVCYSLLFFDFDYLFSIFTFTILWWKLVEFLYKISCLNPSHTSFFLEMTPIMEAQSFNMIYFL